MVRMLHLPSHNGLNTTRGYDREVPTGEVVLFGLLLLLPLALLLILSLFAG